MDVIAEMRETLAEQWITADQIRADDMRARLEFLCPRPSPAVEVRLLVEGRFSAGIIAVEINGELDGSTSQWQPVSLADLPQLSVEDTIRQGRNLYEGYRRGYGFGFADLGARIAKDPDFYAGRKAYDRADRGSARRDARRRPAVHYLVGTPKGRLTRLEKHLIAQPWQQVRPGVQVKLLAQEGELYVLAQSTRPRRQRAGNAATPAEAVVGAAQAALDDAADA